jgi:histidinol-phosphate aminotransferase
MINSGERWPSWLPLRDQLRDRSPYGAPQPEVPVRLNTNENPFGPSKALIKDLERAVGEVGVALNRYPDRDAVELRRALARYINQLSDTTVSQSNIWVANGSNEIIQSIFLAFGGEGRSAMGFEPSYSMHPNIARATGTKWHQVARAENFAIDCDLARIEILSKDPTLVFLTTPNNPTGTITAISDIARLAQFSAQVNALLIVDEAYQEFSNQPSAVTLIDRFPNLIVCRTMSKAFAFAGVRLGYLIAHPPVVDATLLVRLPYHLSSATQALALVALSYSQELLANVALLSSERERIGRELGGIGVKALASGANFFLFETDQPRALWDELLKRGVLIRDVGLTGYLRVTVGTPEENDRFIAALRQALEATTSG